MNLLLVAPPWQLFNRPSIQLGALKAFMKARVPGLEVRACHPYLSYASLLGFTDYHTISQSSWASEAVGAALLNPENHDSCRDIFCRALADRGAGRCSASLPELFDRACALLDEHLTEFVAGLNMENVRLAGLSACLNQFSAALFIARILKKNKPELPIAIGGTSCSGTIAPSILQSHVSVDYVVSGEGELPLLSLWNHLNADVKKQGLPAAVFSRGRIPDPCDISSVAGHEAMCQVKSLEELPVPDFHDYFRELSRLPPADRFYPVLPVEASRGCWWGRCNFCNLNLQWRGYRAKSADRIVREIDALCRGYRCIDFAFMDNVLPRREAADIFKGLAQHNRDYRFFAELRAVHSREEYRVMASGGLSTLQVGIEALSDGLLKRLGKGSSVISNIAAMRHAFESGIELDGNLIVHFPGSTEEEAEETLKILDFVWPFRPLRTVSFWLGHGSPAEERREEFGISRIGPHPWWKQMFGDTRSLILTYAGDRTVQKRRWRQVESRVSEMRLKREEQGLEKVLLGYRDAAEFISIRQILPDGTRRMHRLNGLSRDIYLYCMDVRTVQEVMEMANERISLEQLARFIQGMVNQRLMFSDGTRILSLAVRDR